MLTYQLVRRGLDHKDFCEDFLLIQQINSRFNLYAVFDGCSTGTDSHFASTLMAKTIKAELSFIDLETDCSAREVLDNLLFQSILSLKEIRNALMLETDELLTTLILLVTDELKKSGEILAFGDGYVSINGQDHLIDQDNKPDYLSYYLDMINTYDDFEKCIQDYAIRFTIDAIKNVCISTDGIVSFKNNGCVEDEISIPNAKDYLIHNDFLKNNSSMLSRKCNILKTKFGLINQDDVALIKICNQ